MSREAMGQVAGRIGHNIRLIHPSYHRRARTMSEDYTTRTMAAEGEPEQDSFDDVSYYICEEDGFNTSLSVCESDISETDSEADYDDDDMWLCSVDDEEDIASSAVLSFEALHPPKPILVDGLSAVKSSPTCPVMSDTESETDDDDDDDGHSFGDKSSLSCADIDALEDQFICTGAPATSPRTERRKAGKSIPGEVLYTTFYFTALLAFMAQKDHAPRNRNLLSSMR